ncbi:MAG: hypothetical protein EAY66_01765 [Sphingobacteriales bacterium]|nr:MAG: hypothetical protein EAY66_01765 [Sphingobacteriales bacterium]
MENYKEFIGQTIYVLPESKLNSYYKPNAIQSYSNFSKFPSDAGNVKENQYKPIQTSEYSFVSDYNSLSAKYFKIIDVIDNTDRDKFMNKYNEMGLYLKLESQENHDTLFYQVVKVRQHLDSRTSYPFIIVGYFEKLKQLNINKRFIAQKDITELSEINSGKPVNCFAGSEWNCVDVTLIETKGGIYLEPVFVFKDSLSNEIAVGVEYAWEGVNTSIKDFSSKESVLREKRKQEEELKKQIAEEKMQKQQNVIQSKKNSASTAQAKKIRRENLIKKYGINQGTLIADGKVAVGMTKEMCIASWGRPQDINRTTGTFGVHEQWVYNLKSYLYFEKDILTTIQN